MTTRAVQYRGRRGAAPWVFAAIVIVAAVAGAGLALSILGFGASGGVEANAGGRVSIGEAARTSFGWVAVVGAEKVPGSSSDVHSPTSHAGLPQVKPDEQEVRVTLRIASETSRNVVPYSPDQFHLLVGSEDPPVEPGTSTFLPGNLLPRAAVEGGLGFVVKLDAGHLWLRFDDPAGKPVLFDLDTAVSVGPDDHAHP